MRRFDVDRILTRAILPTGFALLLYALLIDHLRNPAIFSGAVTLITLPAMRAATRDNGKK